MAQRAPLFTFENVSEETRKKLADISAALLREPNAASLGSNTIATAIDAARDADDTISDMSDVDVKVLPLPEQVRKSTFLKNSMAAASQNEEDVKEYGPYAPVIDGGAPNQFIILQKEIGVRVPPVRSRSVTSGSSDCTSSAPSLFITSVDATSCLNVGARAVIVPTGSSSNTTESYVCSAVALGHYDTRGNDLLRDLQQLLLHGSLLPALAQQWREHCEENSSAAAAAAADSNTNDPNAAAGDPFPSTNPSDYDIIIEWYIVGGMMEMRYAFPTLRDLFSRFFYQLFLPRSLRAQSEGVFGLQQQRPVRHRLRPDGLCFWCLNSARLPKKGFATCLVRGLSINTTTGVPIAAEVRRGTRNYPCSIIRAMRFMGTGDDTDQATLLHPPIPKLTADELTAASTALAEGKTIEKQKDETEEYREYHSFDRASNDSDGSDDKKDENGEEPKPKPPLFAAPSDSRLRLSFDAYLKGVKAAAQRLVESGSTDSTSSSENKSDKDSEAPSSSSSHYVALIVERYEIEQRPELAEVNPEIAKTFSTTPYCEPIDYGDKVAEELNVIAHIKDEHDFFGDPSLSLACFQ